MSRARRAAPGLVTTASGLQYKVMKAGPEGGKSPKATDTVKVHYHGTLIDGTVFDSSVQRGEPVEFPLGEVIPGWTEGLQKVNKGGKIKLLEDIRAFEGMEPAAFFKDPRFGFSMMKSVSHVALVTDAPWLKALAETFNFVSPAQIRVFERARLEEARSWLATA